jgi:hypothetical protein
MCVCGFCEVRALIHQLPHKTGNRLKVVHEWMMAAYGDGDGASSKYQIKYWSEQFKWGRNF